MKRGGWSYYKIGASAGLNVALAIASAVMLAMSINGTLFNGFGFYWYVLCLTAWCVSRGLQSDGYVYHAQEVEDETR